MTTISPVTSKRTAIADRSATGYDQPSFRSPPAQRTTYRAMDQDSEAVETLDTRAISHHQEGSRSAGSSSLDEHRGTSSELGLNSQQSGADHDDLTSTLASFALPAPSSPSSHSSSDNLRGVTSVPDANLPQSPLERRPVRPECEPSPTGTPPLASDQTLRSRASASPSSYFPLVAPASPSSSPAHDAPPGSSPSRTSSIFPPVARPSSRPTPSSVFPLVKPSTTPARKMSSTPFPFAEPPATSPASSRTRRPSTTSSTKSGSTANSGSARPRQASLTSSLTPSSPPPSSSSTPYSIASTQRSPSRSTSYAPSIAASSVAPSAEGPTSIFATPVGYKPARSLAGLILTKPSAIVSSSKSKPTTTKEAKGSGKFSSFFSSSSSKDKDKANGGITAPAHLVAGPQRSTSNRILDAALTTSQTWAIRRGEQLAAPASPATNSTFSPIPSGGAFPTSYRPGHQIRREQEERREALEAAESGDSLEQGRISGVRAPSESSVFPTDSRK
ncbi:uncharacterized protein JCM15063_002036 [Sporobolomyces koalae]|uniref:uncharacterized protein n=1 Tax=Sporobolomyces koalae TaxID=500713 RepID=UPI00318257A7